MTSLTVTPPATSGPSARFTGRPSWWTPDLPVATVGRTNDSLTAGAPRAGDVTSVDERRLTREDLGTRSRARPGGPGSSAGRPSGPTGDAATTRCRWPHPVAHL